MIFSPNVQLSNQIAHNSPMDVREAKIAAGVMERESLMIEAEQMQNRGLQIVNVNRLLDDVKPQLVSLTIGDAGFHSAAGQPHRESLGMMIAAELAAEGRVCFDHRRAAE